MFSAQSYAKALQLRDQLSKFSLHSGESITDYAGRLSTLAEHLYAAGDNVDESTLALTLLRGLPSECDSTRQYITLQASPTSPLRLRDVVPKLLLVEGAHTGKIHCFNT